MRAGRLAARACGSRRRALVRRRAAYARPGESQHPTLWQFDGVVRLTVRGGLRAGGRVLVQGTGGVALFGLQIAEAHGADVFVTSGDPVKRARVEASGVEWWGRIVLTEAERQKAPVLLNGGFASSGGVLVAGTGFEPVTFRL